MSIRFATISNLQDKLKKREISGKELVSETKKLFEKYDSNYNSAIEIFKDNFNPIYDERLPLSCIPYLPKDVICQKGREINCASKILSGFNCTYDASVISKLKSDGAVSIGRANCDEFAMGTTGETSHFGPSKNPWDLTKAPGGSSSGSASAVSAGLVPFSLGSETGGSVRLPSSFCNLVGLKPTYGRISRYGIIAYASSLDQVGIFTRSVYDNAIVLSTLAGKDQKDSTSNDDFEKHCYYNSIKNLDLKGKKIGIINETFNAKGMPQETKNLLTKAISEFEKMGAETELVSIKTIENSAAMYFIISRAEVASNLARFDGVKYGHRSKDYSNLMSMYKNTRMEGFGEVAKERILLGNYVLSTGYNCNYYKNAKLMQNEMKKEIFDITSKYDVLFSPVAAGPAIDLGNLNASSIELDLLDYFTSFVNLTGLPALSIPCGFINNMPVGFQLIGKKFSEEILYKFGYQYQTLTDWHTKTPDNF
jgi:aspartyl-tRNA(Asn)/glutamyl-tRNA(Gln) amidotransferase subunit A